MEDYGFDQGQVVFAGFCEGSLERRYLREIEEYLSENS